MGERGKDPKEKKCAICGKEIYAGEDWAYKRKIHGEKTMWFCSYKHMREYDAKTEGPKKPRTETEAPPAPPKEPTSRADQAKALAREILAGRSVIAWLKKEGYKNPHEAYSAVRHYAQTKMPELAETLKPLKDLPKAPAAARTGRPRKPRPVVERVDLVPEVDPGKHVPTLEELREIAETPEPDPDPVQCIAHVTNAEIEEAMKNMRQRHDNLIVPGAKEAEEPEKPAVDPTIDFEEIRKMDRFLHIYSKDDMLRIVDEAALKVQADKAYRWGSNSLELQMFNDARSNAVRVGVMKLRKEIRRMLKAEEDDNE